MEFILIHTPRGIDPPEVMLYTFARCCLGKMSNRGYSLYSSQTYGAGTDTLQGDYFLLESYLRWGLTEVKDGLKVKLDFGHFYL